MLTPAPTPITNTEAAIDFSDLLDRVDYLAQARESREWTGEEAAEFSALWTLREAVDRVLGPTGEPTPYDTVLHHDHYFVAFARVYYDLVGTVVCVGGIPVVELGEDDVVLAHADFACIDFAGVPYWLRVS